MPNGYTAGVVDGEYDAKTYLERCARSRGFAIMQRDDDPDEPVKYRERSDYYVKGLAEAQANLERWRNLSAPARHAEYLEYVEKTKASNADSIAKAAVVKARVQAVRDDITVLEWPSELNSMRDDALKWLDETEEWDGRSYTSQILSFSEWIASHEKSLVRWVEINQEGFDDETKNVTETNRYIDLLQKVLDQL